MNRLVIIGNGFDLAHGLPTSYRDFIDDFWINFKEKCKTEEYKNLVFTHDEYDGYYSDYKMIENFDDLLSNIKNYWNDYPENHFDETSLIFYTRRNSSRDKIFEFKNDFFKRIVQKNSKNWVDIENEYYFFLKQYTKSESLSLEQKKENVKKLNDEFEKIKNLFETYLVENIINKFKLDLEKNANNEWSKFYEILQPISLFSNDENILKEFSNREDISQIKNHFLKEKNNELINYTYFLNFNYTPIVNLYNEILNHDDRINCKINFIHGELQNKFENKINFGFGDEMDDDYKVIENINDNEYLKNFKSFQYLQNNNYDNLLSYIDSEKYQVIILGHSCGLSDRTLLNTIFEHENCRSIKPYYYEIKNEEGKIIGDNYTEIIQNISRHFNDKVKMRSKVVNKTLCKPLPQIQLPKK